jgi:hypothetical protein
MMTKAQCSTLIGIKLLAMSRESAFFQKVQAASIYPFMRVVALYTYMYTPQIEQLQKISQTTKILKNKSYSTIYLSLYRIYVIYSDSYLAFAPVSLSPLQWVSKYTINCGSSFRIICFKDLTIFRNFKGSFSENDENDDYENEYDDDDNIYWERE